MLSPDFEETLRQVFGPEASLREGQREAIEAILKPGARRLLVQSTGWGKSIVYFTAARALREMGRGRTLVISPLIALMRNQVAFARRFGLQAEAVHSENREEWPLIEGQVQNGELDLLLASPERLHQPDFQSRLLPRFLEETALLVIDEAHCISEWGHDFRPEYRTVLRELQDLPKDASLLGTTATATERVVSELRTLFGPELVVQRGKLVRQSLRLIAVPLTGNAERLAWLAKYLPRLEGSGIVYTLTVYDAMEVARWLRLNGIEAAAYHAELDGPQRIELEEAFAANRLKALVATTALGMGYDKADIGFVVHYQTPPSLIAYYQQIGRAGRAMDRAYAVLLAGEEDEEIVESFIQSARPSDKVFEGIVRTLSASSMSLIDLTRDVRAAPSTVRHALDILESADALTIRDGMIEVRPIQAQREIQRGEAIRSIRRKEFEEILGYVRNESCRMQAVAKALGDENASPCGICDRCKPISPPRLDSRAISQAATFLDGEPKVLRPRTTLPVAVHGRSKTLSKDERSLPGVVLGTYGDSSWGRRVREGKYRDAHFAESLVEAAASALAGQNAAPEWLTWVPGGSPDTPLEEFCRRLSARLQIPLFEAVKRVRPRPPQKTMGTAEEQFYNVWDAFEVANVQPGPCLLVDDIVDSGWTLTIVGLRLREAGCKAVLPLALAAVSTSRIRARGNADD